MKNHLGPGSQHTLHGTRHAALLTLIAAAVTACGGGGGSAMPMPSPPAATPSPAPGNPAPAPVPAPSPAPAPGTPTAVSTTVSWAADNITRTTTTLFSDGSSTSTTDVVPPVQTGGTVSQVAGLNQTAPVVNNFGSGAVAVLQDGSVSRPFQQTTIGAVGNTDPNGVVAAPAGLYDLRWGARAAPIVLSTSDNPSVNFSSTGVAYQFTNAFTGAVVGPVVDPRPSSITLPLGLSSSAAQDIWVTPSVREAWAQGWTGAGIKIAVIDDFTPSDRSDFLRFPLATSCGVANVLGTSIPICGVTSTAAVRLTHGEEVAMIAGGVRGSFGGFISEQGLYYNSSGGAQGTYISLEDLNITLQTPYYGVAPGAQVFRNDFLTYQSATNGLFGEFQRWGVGTDPSSQLFREMKVVNLSLGGTSRNPVANTATFNAQLALADATVVPDAVFVKAAGNSSCVVSQTNCDPLNAVLYFSPNFNSKSVLVGALDRDGGSIASYSNVAGNFADRFVVADGRGVDGGDGTRKEGTSFAAPRVSGYVAIIRQKFPNLNAAQTASVILDTATWNPAWGTKSATTQAIYGQGEADLRRALAPVGALR